MNYKNYDRIKQSISGLNNDILMVNKTINNIESLIQMGWLNPSEMTNNIDYELKSILKDIDKSREEDREKIISYVFLNHHLYFEKDKKWLEMNGDTKISTSYSCPHCNSNSYKDEHICATDLVSPGDCGTMDGALFLEKLKCSSCNEEYIIQNGV